MKLILNAMSLVTLIWFHAGCETATGTGTSEKQALDSNRIAAIEAFVKSIDSESFRLAAKKFSPNFYGPRDGIGALYKNGQLVKVTVGLYPDNRETRDYYYFDKGKMILARQLEWVKAPNPSANETIYFLSESEILLTKERSIQLAPGQNPSPVFNQPTVNTHGNNPPAFRQILTKYGRAEKVIKGGQ